MKKTIALIGIIGIMATLLYIGCGKEKPTTPSLEDEAKSVAKKHTLVMETLISNFSELDSMLPDEKVTVLDIFKSAENLKNIDKNAMAEIHKVVESLSEENNRCFAELSISRTKEDPDSLLQKLIEAQLQTIEDTVKREEMRAFVTSLAENMMECESITTMIEFLGTVTCSDSASIYGLKLGEEILIDGAETIYSPEWWKEQGYDNGSKVAWWIPIAAGDVFGGVLGGVLEPDCKWSWEGAGGGALKGSAMAGVGGVVTIRRTAKGDLTWELI
ncbi:MAG: hypothetical protein HY769_08855 [Candidatus Stahlbacteria bacterium]|nr:hypothetical protein [Candidatus Stahlbacteria bacterium]